jgi:hypothetical protein
MGFARKSSAVFSLIQAEVRYLPLTDSWKVYFTASGGVPP